MSADGFSSSAGRPQSPPSAARSRSPVPSRLRKDPPNRTVSSQYLSAREPTLPDVQGVPLGASQELLPPPPTIVGEDPYGRPSSRGFSSRSGTPSGSRPTTPAGNLAALSPVSPGGSPVDRADKQRKHHSFLGSHKKEDRPRGPPAWIAGHPQREPYDLEGLLAARPIPELWDETDGNCYVYLFPRASGKGASFRIDSEIFAGSPALTKLAFGDLYSVNPDADRRQVPLDTRTQNLSINDLTSRPTTPQRSADVNSSTSSHDSRGRFSNLSDTAQEAHLYLPIKLSSENVALSAQAGVDDDVQTLVDIRNFFAFLCGQSLIATEKKGSFFRIFLSIAGILRTYEFSNVDGSTYGEVASISFDNYVDELGLGDVRASREMTIESLVLGERMKSVLLYNEAFTHAAGKYDDLVAMKSPEFNLISPITKNRLARAAMDLDKRVASVRQILTDFDFPSLFSGIMNSRTSEARKEGVRFDEWKDAWWGMRKWTMATLQRRYGHWPPKARSKKNDLETSGLNRQVLVDLYRDMSSLYDLLVDRTKLTTRTVDGVTQADRTEDPTIRALHVVLSEYDRSSPPVKPPVPFDLPKLPDLKAARLDFGTGDQKKDHKALSKKLKSDDIAKILRASSNNDVRATPFVDAFRDMERRAAHGCNISQLVDLRIGQWLFIYVVLQALPMLACDAPGIKHNRGVEYFLCEPPRSGVPWANQHAASASGSGRTWFSVGEGGGVVSLPSDVVEYGVEGIYRRSHCWVMAEKWSETDPTLTFALHGDQPALNAGLSAGYDNSLLPQPPPPTVPPGGLLAPGSRSASPINRNSKRLSSFGLGLEALPLPVGVTPDGRPASSGAEGQRRSSHSVDASKTFDLILGDVQAQKKGKKK